MISSRLYSLYVTRVRWKNSIHCPYCGQDKISRHKLGYFCGICKRTFSSTVKTVFHHSRLPLEKWFQAIAYYFNHEDKPRALWLEEKLAISYPSALRLLRQIRISAEDPVQRGFLLALIGAAKNDTPEHSEGSCRCYWCAL